MSYNESGRWLAEADNSECQSSRIWAATDMEAGRAPPGPSKPHWGWPVVHAIRLNSSESNCALLRSRGTSASLRHFVNDLNGLFHLLINPRTQHGRIHVHH